MTFRHLHDRVAVRRLEGDDKSKGGVIIPYTVKEELQKAG
jgi:chaperonin GroES